MEPKKYAYIDCLRGVAIILVLILHTGSMIGTPYFGENLNQFIENGKFGVLLFFMVSAFTLMLSLNSRKDEKNAFRNFFIRRFFKIVPLYYLALLFYTFTKIIGIRIFITGHAANPIDWGKFLSNMFFCHGLQPEWINSYVPGGWSIANEVTFYLLLPILFLSIKNINSCIQLLIGAVVFSLISDYIIRKPNPTVTEFNFYFFYFPSQFPVFLLGILAYFIVTEGFSKINNSSLILLAVSCFLGMYYPPSYHFRYCFSFLILIIIASKKNYFLLVNPVLAYIGKISYSIYITHFAILMVLGYFKVFNFFTETNFWTTLINFLIRFFVTLLLTIPVAALSYKQIEVRFENIGKRVIKRLQRE